MYLYFVDLPASTTYLRVFNNGAAGMIGAVPVQPAHDPAGMGIAQPSLAEIRLPILPQNDYRVEAYAGLTVTLSAVGALYTSDLTAECGLRIGGTKVEPQQRSHGSCVGSTPDTTPHISWKRAFAQNYGNTLNTSESGLAAAESQMAYDYENTCFDIYRQSEAKMAFSIAGKSDIYGLGRQPTYYAIRAKGWHYMPWDSSSSSHYGSTLFLRNVELAMAEPSPAVMPVFSDADSSDFKYFSTCGHPSLAIYDFVAGMIPLIGGSYSVFKLAATIGEACVDADRRLTGTLPGGAPGRGVITTGSGFTEERVLAGALTWDYGGKGSFEIVFDSRVTIDSWMDACGKCTYNTQSVWWGWNGVGHVGEIH
ncbi:MAG: hypothetical protein QOD77_1973 [Thermoplasmata archaeon]|jgi:hypothetical protein|nr:hypothetical protein [Thermoplasmata archaeon]